MAGQQMRRLIVASGLLLLVSPLGAAPMAAAVRAEIDALLYSLEKSGCMFNRNGSWYSGTEAKAHLQRKLQHFEGRNEVQTAEQFIELAASSSSASAKPYLVKCGTTAPIESSKWLATRLEELRSRSRVPVSSSK
jgi:hypothetical protein